MALVNSFRKHDLSAKLCPYIELARKQVFPVETNRWVPLSNEISEISVIFRYIVYRNRLKKLQGLIQFNSETFSEQCEDLVRLEL